MKFSLCLIVLSIIGLSSCNENQIEARREGLIPIQEGKVSNFGLENIKE